MGLKDIPLEKAYDSDEHDIRGLFYVPVLSQAVKYDRLAGYFSSTTFAIAASGALKFIENNGIMRLVTSTQFSSQDKKAIEEGIEDPESALSRIMLKKLKENPSEIVKKYNALLGWMIANKVNGEPQLQIKIAVPYERDSDSNALDQDSIYHQKIGILYDNENNKISFSGSTNETGKAWIDNIENFKVFRSWGDQSERDFVEWDEKTFLKFWNHQTRRTAVYDLPIAIREELLKICPKSMEDCKKLILELEASFYKKIDSDLQKTIELRGYQSEAVDGWVSNGFRGFFEMATGTGKTFAALGCINRLQHTRDRFVVIISCPLKHLVQQWIGELDRWNLASKDELKIRNSDMEICYSDTPGWKRRLARKIRDFNEKDGNGKYFSNGFIIFTTHSTLSSHDFIDLSNKIEGPIFLIADEVHAVGSRMGLQGLLDKYEFRLGLSATPSRYFDDEGTQNLINYFGKVIIKFTIEDALRAKFLSPYRYVPYAVALNDEEFLKYHELTRKIAKKMYALRNEMEKEEAIYSFVEGERADIISTAENKYDAFIKILDQIKKIDHCLIYCHEKQIDRVKEILWRRNIVFQQITWEETTPERLNYLKQLAEGSYEAILAINCLDEGVDVPSARIGIILASSGNPRQYIQRRGRLLRIHEGKKDALIYDILVVPFLNKPLDAETSELEQKMVRKELNRYNDLVRSASNRAEAEKFIENIRKQYKL